MNKDYTQQLFDEMPVGLIKLKLIRNLSSIVTDSNITIVNKTAELFFNLVNRGTVGLTLNELILSDNPMARDIALTGIENLNTKRNVPFYHNNKETDRTYKIMVTNAEPEHLNVILVDITEEILLERESKKAADSMANFYTFFNAVYDMLFILDNQGNILHANQTVFDRLGFTQEDLYGKSVLQVHPVERRDEALANVVEMLQGKREYCPVPIISKSGQIIAVETRVKNGFWDGNPVLLGVVKDISDLKRSEEKFSKAFYNSGSLMAISRLSDSIIIDVNEAYLTHMGYSREEVIGKTSLELGIFVDEKARQHTMDKLQFTNSIYGQEVQIRNKAGEIATGLFNIDLFHLDNELCIMTSMIDITHHIQKEEEVTRNNQYLTEMVNQKVQEIAEAQLATIGALSNITESRDTDTGSHVERLKEGCKIVAEKLSTKDEFLDIITPEFINKLQYASVIHDIGKVGIKDSILLKNGKLTTEEFDHIKTHPVIGAKVLKQVYQSYPGNKYIEMGIEIAESHHEWFNGKGYPNQLSGNDIPLSAQILAVCDVYDALRSKRPYKEPLDHDASLKQIISEKGTHFNPLIVDAFVSCDEAIRDLYIQLLD
jgi:PAS domain S-box-containing protein